MVGDMLLVHELGSIFCTQNDRLIMTLEALPFGDMAISLNNTEVAFLTGHPS